MIEIGITERGDASSDLSWLPYVNNGGYAILISKNPVSVLKTIENNCDEDARHRIILHATITGYAGTELESNVPVISDEGMNIIKTAKNNLHIADLVLRVDPIIPTEEGTKVACDVLDRYYHNELNNRVRISFIDNYYHIRDRGVVLPWDSLNAPISMRRESYNKILEVCNKYNYALEVCGEPGFDSIGCISIRDLQAFGIDYSDIEFPQNYQRYSCTCLGIKRELLNNRHPCSHGCKYCYWKD